MSHFPKSDYIKMKFKFGRHFRFGVLKTLNSLMVKGGPTAFTFTRR